VTERSREEGRREDGLMVGGRSVEWELRWAEEARWSLRLAARRSMVDDSLVRYRSTAADFHRPKFLTSSREMPADMAELAAPRRNECPEKVDGSWPAARTARLTEVSRYKELNGPKLREKSGWDGVLG